MYLSLVTMISEYNGHNSFSDFQWPDSVSIQHLTSRFRSQARSFVINNKAFFDGNITLENFTQTLEQQFVTQMTPRLELEEPFAGVRQQPGEDVRVYGEKVRAIYQRALPIDDSGNAIESSALNDCAKVSFQLSKTPAYKQTMKVNS